jgi:hypothetical protein
MLDMRITRTGGMTGHAGVHGPGAVPRPPTDARTDQFSFCVALYEGLYGVRPFLGERVAVVREAVLGGHIQDVPKDSDVPPWLRRILVPRPAGPPEERFRSMEELLGRLSDDPRRRARDGWRSAAALVLAGVAAAPIVALTLRGADDDPRASAHALCDVDAALAACGTHPSRQAVAAALGDAQASPADSRARASPRCSTTTRVVARRVARVCPPDLRRSAARSRRELRPARGVPAAPPRRAAHAHRGARCEANRGRVTRWWRRGRCRRCAAARTRRRRSARDAGQVDERR